MAICKTAQQIRKKCWFLNLARTYKYSMIPLINKNMNGRLQGEKRAVSNKEKTKPTE